MSELLSQLSTELARVVAETLPSVVRVETSPRNLTGVVWSEDGVLVTTGPDLDEPVTVALGDEPPRPATFVGRDPMTHVAVLRTDASGLAVPRWREAKRARLGELVASIRRTERLPRVALGMLEAVGGPWQTPTGFRAERYLESGVAAGRSGSGCLVVDATGAAMGVGAPSLGGGSGLLLDPSSLGEVIGAILRYGRVRRSYLGISAQSVPLPAALAEAGGQAHGLLLTAVHEGSPAARAGLMLGDVLLRAGDETLERVSDLMALLEADRIDQPVVIRLIRGGQAAEQTVVPGARP